MQPRDTDIRRPLVKRDKRDEQAHASHCVQCGDALDADAVKARARNMMCADCAFDAIPCTD